MGERNISISVLGLGYIGLPTASMLAAQGFDVVGVDVDPRVVEALSKGEVHIQEPGLNALVRSAIQSGNLTVASRPRESDIFVIAVPTPVAAEQQHHNGSRTDEPKSPPQADLSYVASAARTIAHYLRPGNLVILESTSPPGTTTTVVRPILEETGLEAGRDFGLAFCAERVLPRRILIELVENDRVIGGIDEESAERARALYETFVEGEIFLTDATTAELVKLMENTFRDVNIALANEFSRVADVVGVDVGEAIALANHHPRVTILQPGPGVGGHCIAVDPWFIASAAPDVTPLIRTAREVNDHQPRVVAELVARAVHDLENPTIAVLGLAYKADVDDLRESPSFEVMELLQERGYKLRPHDPMAENLPDGTPLEPDLTAVLDGADLMLILTDHALYRQLKPSDAGPANMAHGRVVDTRSCLDHTLWRSEGFTVTKLGSGKAARDRIGSMSGGSALR